VSRNAKRSNLYWRKNKFRTEWPAMKYELMDVQKTAQSMQIRSTKSEARNKSK